MGLELSGVIDPDLNWKTATKGRRRAVRRARTSFIEGNRKKCMVKISTSSKDISDIESMGDVSVSESEKVGVTILGQHFSESLKSVPIKKRRLFSCSPSTLSPHCHSVYSDDFSMSQMTSFQGTLGYEHHKRRLSLNKRSTTKINGKACDTADFSGISILASAACNSDTVCDIRNAEGLNTQGHYSNEEALSNTPSTKTDSLCAEKVQHMLISETHERKCSLPINTCPAVSVEIVDLTCNKSSVAQLKDVSDKVKPSSCDPKHKWDLNSAVMGDVWDNSSDEIVNYQLLPTDHRIESSQSEKKSVLETFNSEANATCVSEFENHTFDGVGSLMDNHVAVKAECEKEHDISNVKSSYSKEAKQCSVSCRYGNDEMDHQLDVSIVSLVGSNEEITPVSDQRITICGAKTISSTDEAFVSYPVKSDEFGKSFEMESTNIVYGENATCHTTHQNSHFSLGESTREEVSCENADENKSTDKSNVESGIDDHCLIDSHLRPVKIIKPQIERNLGMHNSNNTKDYPSTNHLDVIASNEPVDGKNATCDASGDVLASDELIIPQEHHGDKAYRAGTEPCPSSTICCHNIESSNDKIFPSGTAHDGTFTMGTLDQMVSDHKCAILSDANLLCTKGDYSCHDNLNACSSPGTIPLKISADIVDDAVGDKVESKCYLDSYVNSSMDSGLDDTLHCTSETNSVNKDVNQDNGMKKIDLMDDDSQYEDGEFRESVLHGWGDATEEEEIEHLDYGSDNRENYVLEPPTIPPVCLPVDSMACKDVQVTTCDGAHSCKDLQLTIYQPSLKCSSMLEVLDAGYVKSDAGRTHIDYLGVNDGRKSQRFVRDASVSDIVTDNISVNIDDCNREASTSTRMKMSGWDQLPESCRHNREKFSDTTIASTQNPSGGSFNAVGTCGSFMMSGSSFRKDLSSRIEHSSSLDGPQRSYSRVIRSDNHIDLDAKAEGDADAPNLSGRLGPFLHAQGGDSGESCFEPSNRGVLRNHDSSAYYGTHRFSQSGSRNAAAAAVAKVESNGFVVAPDGTLVKAGGGSACQLPRRSANCHASRHALSVRGSSHERNHTCDMWKRLPRPREMSPNRHYCDERDRVGRYDHDMVRNRYHRPAPDNDINLDLLPLPRSRKFSPHRGNLRLSRSRSRSRTRSPRHWTSPKGGSVVRMNSGSVLRRRSRSPLIFKQDARIGRIRSHQQPNYGDHIMAYGPRMRSFLSYEPSDSRKESPDHLRELEYRQDSGRTAAMKMLRNQRFKSMDSQGRLKPDEYYCRLSSRKVPEFSGFGRASGQDGIQDGRRGHDDRYELPHLPRKHGVNNSIKRSHYGGGENFQNHFIGFQRMGSPRNFDRRTRNCLEDSPDKIKEKKRHFRYDDKFSKHSMNFNSYEDQELDNNIDNQGRSS